MVELTNANVAKSDVARVERQNKHEQKRDAAAGTKNNTYVADTLLVRFNSNAAKGEFIKAKKNLGAVFNEQVKQLAVKTVERPRGQAKSYFLQGSPH